MFVNRLLILVVCLCLGYLYLASQHTMQTQVRVIGNQMGQLTSLQWQIDKQDGEIKVIKAALSDQLKMSIAIKKLRKLGI